MRIRALLAVLLFLAALVALGAPASAHHRPGHGGGPGTAVQDDGEEREETTEGSDAYGHGGEDEEGGQGAGVGVSLAIIVGSVVLITALGLKPRGSEPAHH